MSHKLEIKNKRVSLDDFGLKGVIGYELKGSPLTDKAELTLVLLVSNPDLVSGKEVAAGTTTIQIDSERFAKDVFTSLNANCDKHQEVQK